jgi:hypothetical protein
MKNKNILKIVILLSMQILYIENNSCTNTVGKKTSNTTVSFIQRLFPGITNNQIGWVTEKEAKVIDSAKLLTYRNDLIENKKPDDTKWLHWLDCAKRIFYILKKIVRV